jgi:hypothetical protein
MRRDDFSTVKRQRDGFGAFRKETRCHPASSRPTSSTDISQKWSTVSIVRNCFESEATSYEWAKQLFFETVPTISVPEI